MDTTSNAPADFITSVEILNTAGISRATLNNYIKYGLIPKPTVTRPRSGTIKAKNIGFFPVTVLERIEQIKRLKGEGNSMENIVRMFSEQNQMRTEEQSRVSCQGNLNVSVNDIRAPAYLVSNQFEIEWINEGAEEKVFHLKVRELKVAHERNVFRLLLSKGVPRGEEQQAGLLMNFMELFKENHEKHVLRNMYPGLTDQERQYLEEMYDRVEYSEPEAIQESLITAKTNDGRIVASKLYHVRFREGMLFIHGQANELLQEMEQIVSRRGTIISELLKQRMPSLVSFAVLVADLQDSTRICAELPPEEYFELIRDIWKCMDGIFVKYYGTYGKHVGDGMVYYFLRNKDSNYILNSIYCAIDLREKIKQLSMEWKLRKGWQNDLYLNIGINEGEEYFGTVFSSSNLEFTALGDSVNYAGRLSDLAQYGRIWTTKNLLNHLSIEERKRIHFGIRRAEQGRELFNENLFSRVMDLVRNVEGGSHKYMDIATLAVTEISSVSPM